MAERIIYHVVPETGGGWKITRVGGGVCSVHPTKQEAIAEARRMGRREQLGQVVVHGMNGRIETEWTYGEDPRRHVG